MPRAGRGSRRGHDERVARRSEPPRTPASRRERSPHGRDVASSQRSHRSREVSSHRRSGSRRFPVEHGGFPEPPARTPSVFSGARHGPLFRHEDVRSGQVPVRRQLFASGALPASPAVGRGGRLVPGSRQDRAPASGGSSRQGGKRERELGSSEEEESPSRRPRRR